MNPILLDLGVIKIYWYSVFILLGMLSAGFYVSKESKKYEIPKEVIENLFFWVIVFGVLGARVYYVVFHFNEYMYDPLSIFRIWEKGLAIHGGILFGLVFTILYSKKYNIKPLLMIDMIVVGLILGQAIGRWGNFFNQEAFGSIAGTTITESTLRHLLIPGFVIKGMYIRGTYYLPMFYFESIWCLLGFGVLLLNKRRRYLKIGQLTSIYLMWYGIGRFFIEMFRTDSLMLGSLKMAQIVSISMVVIGLVMYVLLSKGSRFNNLYNKNYEED